MKAIVIGAGIAGLACARALRLQGYDVTIYERHKKALGASIQNFGMFWHIGMAIEDRPYAARSRAIWLDVLEQQEVYNRTSGALLLATRDAEWDVLKEFSAVGGELGFETELLSKEETEKRSPVVNQKHLKGEMKLKHCIFSA